MDFKSIQNMMARSAKYIMNFVDLVDFIGSGEERKQTQHFEKDATHSPDVHFVVLIAVGQQALRRTVPAGRNVLGERRVRELASARAKVGQLQSVA